MSTFYITTPIYYANSLPHLGHLYTTIVADAVHRYKQQRGFDVFFLTGTDEHGVNIQRAAEKAGKTPKEQVDLISNELKRMFSDFGLDPANGGYDIFMRTTEPFHYQGVQHLWREIARNKTPKGNETIYKGHYEGWFCAPCAAYKLEDEYFTPDGSDVPFCSIHERPLDRVSEESYFFRLSDYAEFLLETIESDLQILKPESRRNEVISFIKGGLQDLSISRERKSVSWGVPVPGDDDHVMYVWLDALSNYITAIGYGNDRDGSVGFEKYWQNAIHLVGKDILRFHTVYWFSFLKAAGLPLPRTVYAHGMWLDSDGRKMGKTLGNVIEVDVLHQHFQVDAVRYFCLREMVFGQDGKFGYENLIERANSDLASGLGNLLSRTVSMIQKYREGRIPSGKIAEANYLMARRAGIDPDGQEIVSVVQHARDEFIRRFDNYEFSLALETLWAVIARVDKMISDAKPWELAKDEKNAETLNAVLYRSAETIRWLATMVYPAMPRSAEDIYSQLGLQADVSSLDPASLVWGSLEPGTSIGEIVGIFPRIDRTKVMNEINETVSKKTELSAEVETLSEPAPAVTGPGAAEQPDDSFITIDDFLKVELRVGQITVAERVPKADKLLRFEVDLGEEQPRQILAGLAEYYEPEKLVGRKVVVVANLKPRMMRGLESQGMICAASLTEEDTPAIATFLEDVKIGARLK
ncbi:MAG TPA: methionine--tRNA ligase [Pyrinomonadaceae bacterium]|nr:methionine--tRNA ligase [Chloracidobacterium sp.]HRJ89442.1 methionine--tRNA ligase [Pyrinomonadaceae bacterium]HRK51623.1 methionine--tRNA ligase [Pyrinomonadaceae bacterium]